MKILEFAKERARSCKKQIGVSPENLLDRVKNYLWESHRIELRSVNAASIRNSKAEIRPDQNSLLYDKELLNDPDELIFYIVHELGHLEIHQRLSRECDVQDPFYSSMYGISGEHSLIQYNPRSLEEVQANAFAAEFLCSSNEAFRIWKDNSGITMSEIAQQLGSPLFIVRSQLADALYKLVFVKTDTQESYKKNIKCVPKQEEAAKHRGNPVLVDAGPGTGKTATLIRRIEFLLGEIKVEPSSILILTFSNEACNELYERISAKFGDEITSEIRIATFHGFGLSIVQSDEEFKDTDANLSVLDDAAQQELVSEALARTHCFKILKVSQPDVTVKEIVRYINFLKGRMHKPEDLERSIDEWQAKPEVEFDPEKSRDFLKVFREYENLKDARRKLDFADLIQKSVDILSEKPDVQDIYQEKYKWILVDEYQDVSRATAVLLQKICGSNNHPWVVGDKRQSIFRFAGANSENMDKFEQDFPNAKRFSLNKNYRSSEQIVENSNKFANLMQTSERNGLDSPEVIWEASPGNPTSDILPAVSFAVADSDEAEYKGIVEQIEFWKGKQVNLKDMAVLARRNLDVRNIVLALTNKHIEAIASGIVTADGAAGDLATILTLADKLSASLPRLVYCLGREDFSSKELNDILAESLDTVDQEIEAFDGEDKKSRLLGEIARIHSHLNREKFSSDAFSTICLFLFEASDYLRRILNSENEVEKSLALNEIVTTLSYAATYRFSHQGISPYLSRKGFADYFREALTKASAPTTLPTGQFDTEAVKVMTCHASKGLEFPYVVVAGQTLSPLAGRPKEFEWLPPILRRDLKEDEEQSDSALFVGMTRARQGLVVSHAKTQRRSLVPLLKKGLENNALVTKDWSSQLTKSKEAIVIGNIWGGNLEFPIAARKLASSECSTAIYMQNGRKIEFPTVERSFYITFSLVVRNVMNGIVKNALINYRQTTTQEAIDILEKEWEEIKYTEHKYYDLYKSLARKYIEDFANSYIPEEGSVEFIDLANGKGIGKELHMDLVCAYLLDNKNPKAILFRPESLKKSAKDNGILWSALAPKRKVSLVLLRSQFPDLEAKIFSGADGMLDNFIWPGKGYYEKELAKVEQKYQELLEDKFVTTVEPFSCDVFCDHRLSCPHWLGA